MSAQGYRLVGATAIVVDGSTEVSGDTAAELVIRDGRIAAEATGDERIIDVSGCVITAGLVNAHHHLLQSAFRTIPATRGVPMSAWLPAMAAE